MIEPFYGEQNPAYSDSGEHLDEEERLITKLRFDKTQIYIDSKVSTTVFGGI